jgi:branched-chain amino acid transport system substrate-binding protein
MRVNLLPLLFFLLTVPAISQAQDRVKVGIATILSGDLAVVGDNIQKSVKIYDELYPNQKIEILFEDARLGSSDGLRAYQKLISSEKVNLTIAACTSNGTMAATSLFNASKTPVISVSTGGSNIDRAGEFVFRIGNSDSLNGIEQATYFVDHGITRVAVLTEQTEYTQDITRFFVPRFTELGGTLVFNEEFVPGTDDFRTMLVKLRQSKPQAIFIPTQTGTALGVILKQWHQLAPDSRVEIHTTFVAGPNRDAHQVAGELIVGVFYMEPTFSETNDRRKRFFAKYRELFGSEPAVPFHTAGLADTLDLLSKYLETHTKFEQESFRKFLLSIKDYDGMLGKLTFDKDGNTVIGFRIKRIEHNLIDAEDNQKRHGSADQDDR